MSKSEDLSSLLGSLALKEKNNELVDDEKSQKLQRELSLAGFRIFECLSDNGYFAWNAPRHATYQNLASMTSIDQLMLSSCLDVNGKPDKLVADLKSLKTPRRFLSLPSVEHQNKFPHSKMDVVCFHVAAKYRGVDFDNIDFAFGGSTLEMLANRDASDPFMVTYVPGTKTIMVAKNKDYIKNLSDVGFQFERLVTGVPMDEHVHSKVFSSVEHLQVMNIGQHRVFFRAETDAILDDGSSVEIKASNPRYWGTKVMFQMISSGSTHLCFGAKARGGGSLSSVELQSLQQVTKKALQTSRMATLEANILQGMESLQSEMQGAAPGEVFKVSFHGGGSLKLLPVRGRSGDILPPAEIVGELIGVPAATTS